jgi:hypothetical protein
MYKKVQEYYQQKQETNKELEEKVQTFRSSLEEQFSIVENYQPKVRE